jgi:hypothetical protein
MRRGDRQSGMRRFAAGRQDVNPITPADPAPCDNRSLIASRALRRPGASIDRTLRMSWYVLYRERGANAFERFGDRETALAAAFALICRGLDVIEVGRSGGTEADAIGGAEIRRLIEGQSPGD